MENSVPSNKDNNDNITTKLTLPQKKTFHLKDLVMEYKHKILNKPYTKEIQIKNIVICHIILFY